MRLDRTLGELFDALDAAVGRDRYVVGLSADHGVSPIPEAASAPGRRCRTRARPPKSARRLKPRWSRRTGRGRMSRPVAYTNIYFTPVTHALVEKTPEAIQPMVDAVSRMPGVLACPPRARARREADQRRPDRARRRVEPLPVRERRRSLPAQAGMDARRHLSRHARIAACLRSARAAGLLGRTVQARPLRAAGLPGRYRAHAGGGRWAQTGARRGIDVQPAIRELPAR